jgi:hypothetical protein
MKVIQGIKEFIAFIATTALSCGVSQIFGTIKLIVDTRLLFSNQTKAQKISQAIEYIHKNSADFKNIEMIDTIARRLRIQKEELSLETVNMYLAAHSRKAEAKTARLYRSLKADACALIPLIGAHISWRIATEYKGKSFTPVFSRGIQHLLENFPKRSSKPFFWGRGQKMVDGIYKECYIPVNTSTKNRSIIAFCEKAITDLSIMNRAIIKKLSGVSLKFNYDKYDSKKFTEIENSFSDHPTVVVFHHNAGGGHSMRERGEIYRRVGFNVLLVTIGGYPESTRITTSEGSMYQDVEAVKQYLKAKGVKEVAWHGESMGTGLAIHAAADLNPEGLKTLFVVADQPYNSAAGVAGNMFGPLGEGVLRAGLPEGRPVELPGGREIFTDGLDNLKKTEKLKELGIPLICSEGAQDFFMGRNKVNGRYQANFATDLLKKRYSKNERSRFIIKEDRAHGGHMDQMKLYHVLYKEKLLPKNILEFLDQEDSFFSKFKHESARSS